MPTQAFGKSLCQRSQLFSQCSLHRLDYIASTHFVLASPQHKSTFKNRCLLAPRGSGWSSLSDRQHPGLCRNTGSAWCTTGSGAGVASIGCCHIKAREARGWKQTQRKWAMSNMEEPAYVSGVRQFMGMVTHLGKYLPSWQRRHSHWESCSVRRTCGVGVPRNKQLLTE